MGNYCKCNFPITPPVCPLVGRLLFPRRAGSYTSMRLPENLFFSRFLPVMTRIILEKQFQVKSATTSLQGLSIEKNIGINKQLFFNAFLMLRHLYYHPHDFRGTRNWELSEQKVRQKILPSSFNNNIQKQYFNT